MVAILQLNWESLGASAGPHAAEIRAAFKSKAPAIVVSHTHLGGDHRHQRR